MHYVDNCQFSFTVGFPKRLDPNQGPRSFPLSLRYTILQLFRSLFFCTHRVGALFLVTHLGLNLGKGINSNIYACAITPAWTFAFVVVVVVGVGANLKASTE